MLLSYYTTIKSLNAFKGCEVKVFQVRYLKDYSNVFCGLIVKKKGKYFGGLSAVQKVMSRKRIPLCSHHYDMLKNKQLCFSHLALSDKFVEAKKKFRRLGYIKG